MMILAGFLGMGWTSHQRCFFCYGRIKLVFFLAGVGRGRGL